MAETGLFEQNDIILGSEHLHSKVIVTDQDHCERLSKSFGARAHVPARLKIRSSISHSSSETSRALSINYRKVMYVLAGDLLARYISRLAGYSMCNEIGQAVASVLAIIFTAVSDYYGGQPKPAPKSQAQCSPQSPSFNSYQDMFVAAMEDHGLQYADILPGIPTHGIKKRRDGEPELLERFLIRGFLHIHYPVKSAFQVNYYSNGSVVVNSSLGAVEDLISGLGERYDNPGLKVTCSMERYNERDLYERDYHPLVGMTSDITGYWTGSGTTVSRPEYTGYDSEAEGEDMINFYFEIIPWI